MFEGLREVRLQSQKTLLLFFYAHIKCILLTSHCTSDKEKNIEHIQIYASVNLGCLLYHVTLKLFIFMIFCKTMHKFVFYEIDLV